MIGYVGVSSVAAPLLVATGWRGLRLECAAIAEVQARRAAFAEGGYPVVLRCEVTGGAGDIPPGLSARADVDPLTLEVHDVLGDAPTALARLGFEETADVGGFVNGLLKVLDESHRAIRSAIDVGSGSSAELPSASMLKRAVREIRGRDPDGDDADEDFSGKAKRDANHERARRRAKNGLNKFFKKTHKAVMKKIDGLAKKKGVKKKVAPRKRPARSDWAPRGKKTESDKVAWSPAKKARVDTTVSGKLNGKKATLKILAGKTYRVAKTQEGLRVSRPGLRGVFIANPSDSGKL